MLKGSSEQDLIGHFFHDLMPLHFEVVTLMGCPRMTEESYIIHLFDFSAKL